jgi:hypothetical protein
MVKVRKYSEFGNCKICKDSATGIHYSVASCEGCKGFFKRSVLLKKKYECYYDYKCIISIENRIRCKGCRFKNCIDSGMSPSLVCVGFKKRAKNNNMYDEKLKKLALAHIENEEKSKNTIKRILERIQVEPITSDLNDLKCKIEEKSNDEVEFFNLNDYLGLLQEPLLVEESSTCSAESINLQEEISQPNALETTNLEEPLSLEVIKSSLFKGIDNLLESMIQFLKQMPDFYIQNFSDHSFLINNRLFDYFLV